jgi:hypothetical protein
VVNPNFKVYYQDFFWVLIDLIVELLGLIIEPFDNQKSVIVLYENVYVSCMCLHHPDSFVISDSSQVGNLVFIDVFNQCPSQRLVHGPFLEIIMLFSSCSKESLNPSSRSRAVMELSPHPNDIRVRSLHMSVP